jgi:hypothetical protein
MPGVLSYKLRRPRNGERLFTGPLDDVAPGDDVFSPLHRTSQFCAPCHHGVFWGTVVYNSFGEWLNSDYNNEQTGATCQECHMTPHGATHLALPAKGGRWRRPETIHSHRMPGAADEALLAGALTLTLNARSNGRHVTVMATVTNTGAGHHVPTGSPLRHVILWVEATGDAGQSLELVDGSTLPEWCGEGDPQVGPCASAPGKVFAKVLEEQWTGVSPTAAYWNPTRVVSDNRIAAKQSDESTYTFRRGASGPTTIRAHLVFRRAFAELQRQKGWNVPDILMGQAEITVVE